MTSFGWKKISGGQLKKKTTTASVLFTIDDSSQEDIDTSLRAKSKKQKVTHDESLQISKRLKAEGSVLAGKGRFFEAIRKWEEALLHDPTDAASFEMTAQAHLVLQKPYQAMQAAEKAIRCKPNWWVGYQTLGRTQMALGEVQKAVLAFSKAVHLNPAEREVWEEDFKWAANVLQKYQQLQKEKEIQRPQVSKPVTIKELDEGQPVMAVQPYVTQEVLNAENKNNTSKSEETEKDQEVFDITKYVRMRT